MAENTMKEGNEILNEEEEGIVELVADDGEVAHFYHIATLEHKGEWYVYFQPAEEMEGIGEDEIVIFQLGTDEEDGADIFLPIEDEALLEEVYEEYLKLAEEDECDCDHEDCDCAHEEGKCNCGHHKE